MKFLRQIAVIFVFSLLGELCRFLIPLPIPASIYGMVLLFAGLALKLIPPAAVNDAGGFLTSILPLLFVAPAVNLMSCWDYLKDSVVAIVGIVLVTTVLTFGCAGLVTQWLTKKGGEDNG